MNLLFFIKELLLYFSRMKKPTIREMLDHIVVVGPNGEKFELTETQKKEAEIFIQMAEDIRSCGEGEWMYPYLRKSHSNQKWEYHCNSHEFPIEKI